MSWLTWKFPNRCCGIGDNLSNPKDLIKKCFLSFNVNIFGLSCDGKIRTIGKKRKKGSSV